MKNYTKAITMLKDAETIAIFMHVNPDGDCIGSSLALYGFLTKLNKTVHCFSASTENNSVPQKLEFLPYSDVFNKNQLKSYDLSIGVDVADANRIGDSLFKVFLSGKSSLVFDHHEGYIDFAKHTVREVNSASTTQILYKLMTEYDKSIIDTDIATLLYAGIVTDSGCFSFSSTSKETHLIAAELFDYGIDYSDMNYRLLRDIPKDVFNLKMRVLSNAKFYEEGQIAAIVFRTEDFKQTNTYENNTDGIINSILDISSVEIAISIAEIGDKKFKVSFRTKDKVNASACAKCFGGGGHAHAAGCRVYGFFDDAYQKVIDVAKEMLSYA